MRGPWRQEALERVPLAQEAARPRAPWVAKVAWNREELHLLRVSPDRRGVGVHRGDPGRLDVLEPKRIIFIGPLGLRP